MVYAPKAAQKATSAITTAEALDWFQNRVGDAKLLNGFVALLNLHIIIKLTPRRSTWLSPRAVIGAAHALRGDLDRLQEALGPQFWGLIGAPPGGMERLRTALTELGDFLRPAPKTRGHAVWHEHASWYAAEIADILRKAGHRAPSTVNGKGPVAAIGAKAVARVWQVTISAGTFAGVVRCLRDSARLRLKSTPAGRLALEDERIRT